MAGIVRERSAVLVAGFIEKRSQRRRLEVWFGLEH